MSEGCLRRESECVRHSNGCASCTYMIVIVYNFIHFSNIRTIEISIFYGNSFKKQPIVNCIMSDDKQKYQEQINNVISTKKKNQFKIKKKLKQHKKKIETWIK